MPVEHIMTDSIASQLTGVSDSGQQCDNVSDSGMQRQPEQPRHPQLTHSTILPYPNTHT